MENVLYSFNLPTEFKEVLAAVASRQIDSHLISQIEFRYDGRGKVECLKVSCCRPSRINFVLFENGKTHAYLHDRCIVCMSLEEAETRMDEWINKKLNELKVVIG